MDTRTSTHEFAPGLFIDIVKPASTTEPHPAIIWLHGGGWRLGDRTGRPDLNRHFAVHGYVMASIDYRLAPATRHPGQLHDVRAAVRWLRTHADAHHVDPDRIGLWGSSAGGHLAALAGVHSHVVQFPGETPTPTSAAVQAVVDGYGPADLTATAKPEATDTPEAALLGGAIRDWLDAARDASPALQVASAAPPFLIMHGADDDLVPPAHSEALYDALAAHGAEAALYVIDGFGHGFFNPGEVLELGPGQALDQGHLDRDPNATARIRATPALRSLAEDHPSASFSAVETFFARTLKAAS
ncbi:alpha/beta hydrolase fold domain-containing protein [Mycolicibacterium wolinskyi]|uniref:alpha/beta hydrolase fold domain-containing protein n=1 Tax=Mycolicibacterium wolinskyi TaxID=59750 RepID=UPI003917A54A